MNLKHAFSFLYSVHVDANVLYLKIVSSLFFNYNYDVSIFKLCINVCRCVFVLYVAMCIMVTVT